MHQSWRDKVSCQGFHFWECIYFWQQKGVRHGPVPRAILVILSFLTIILRNLNSLRVTLTSSADSFECLCVYVCFFSLVLLEFMQIVLSYGGMTLHLLTRQWKKAGHSSSAAIVYKHPAPIALIAARTGDMLSATLLVWLQPETSTVVFQQFLEEEFHLVSGTLSLNMEVNFPSSCQCVPLMPLIIVSAASMPQCDVTVVQTVWLAANVHVLHW